MHSDFTLDFMYMYMYKYIQYHYCVLNIHSLFHLLYNATLKGEHPDTEDQLVLQLKCDAAIQ